MFFPSRQHMESYQEACPDQVEGFKNEVVWLNARLMQELKDQYKEDVMVHFHYSNSKQGRDWWNLISTF